ncbi:hypothetical protein AAG906_033651 [Vitis piasezkii]
MVDGRQQSSAEMADDEANRKLIRIGGVASVHMEFNDLHASKASREVESRKTLGFGSSTALISSDHCHGQCCYYPCFSLCRGRKLFLEGGAQMLTCQIFVTIDIAFKFGISGKPGELSKEFAAAVVLLICVSIAGFASCLIDEVEDEDGSEDKEELFMRLPFA